MENISPHHPQKTPEDLKAYAREMRKTMPTAEQLLWYLIRNRRIAGAKFRRQHPVGRYILDFYCVEKKLAVELDGGQHSEQQNYDQQRDAYLEQQGIEVLRFWNNQMLLETEAVLESIYLNLVGNNPSPASGEFQMLGRGEGGQVTAQCFSKLVYEKNEHNLLRSRRQS